MTDMLQKKLTEVMNVNEASFPEMADPESQRRLFLNGLQKTPSHGLNKWVAATALASAAVILLASVLIDRTSVRQEQVAFEVGPNRLAGEEGVWLETKGDTPVPIRFGDGSELVMNRASARIGKVSDGQVVVDLVSGQISCSIRPDSGLDWTIRAGTYRVHVTGTVFDVVWHPQQSQLRVSVSRGSVHVEGDDVTENGLRLLAGNYLEFHRGNVRISPILPDFNPVEEDFLVAHETDGSELRSSDDALPTPDTKGHAAATLASAPVQRENAQPKEIRDWLFFYNQKDYAGSIAQARSEGLDSLISDLTAEDLDKLARAARYAGQGDVAMDALTGLNRRFKGTHRGNNALFLLGRVTLEMQGNPAAAGRWFEAYLEADPEGKLQGESLGRLVEIHRANGDMARAQQYARRYLKKFPDGSFASLAHSVLQ